MIKELLGTGKATAKTGKELATLLGVNIRIITAQIERERRAGVPICANNENDHPGYFIAENRAELKHYCDVLHKRASQLYKTRSELLKVLDKYKEPSADDDL